jgi:hypothetical protein
MRKMTEQEAFDWATHLIRDAKIGKLQQDTYKAFRETLKQALLDAHALGCHDQQCKEKIKEGADAIGDGTPVVQVASVTGPQSVTG